MRESRASLRGLMPCLSQGIDEFGGFGRFGRFKKFNVFKRFNACLSQGFDKLNYTIEIIRRVGVGI
jgi:hypothetical protein